MVRRSSAKSPAPVAARPAAPAPVAAAPAAAPAPAPASSGMMAGLAGSMMSGMATGVGMSLASRAVDAVLGGRETVVIHKQATGNDCSRLEELMTACAFDCQPHIDALAQCRQ